MLNAVSEFEVLSQQLDDPDVDAILNIVVQLLSDQQQLTVKAPLMVVKLEALAAKFALLARYYTTIDKSNNVRKNVYYTLSEQAHQLAAAMKYVVR